MTRSCEGDLISKASGLEGLPGPIPPMTRSCEGDLTSKASGLEGLPGLIPPMIRSCERDLTSRVNQDSRDPLDLLEHLPPKPESVCLTLLCLSPTLLTLTGGYP